MLNVSNTVPQFVQARSVVSVEEAVHDGVEDDWAHADNVAYCKPDQVGLMILLPKFLLKFSWHVFRN